MGFWDFGRFGCIPSVPPQSRKVFGEYPVVSKAVGEGGFREVFFGEEICTRVLGSSGVFDCRFPVAVGGRMEVKF